jgi:catechol 2,3-dioxygenase
MPVPAPVLYPPFNIVRLSHVEYGVTDLAASRAFYVDTLGLQVTHEDADSIYLRAMEERGHHCIALRKSDAACARVLGFKLYDEPDLEKAEAFFRGKGLPVEWVERPFMGRTLRTCDPFGKAPAHRPFQHVRQRCGWKRRLLYRAWVPHDRIYRG